MKPVVEAWHSEGLADVLADWQFWVMAGAGLVGFYLQRAALAKSTWHVSGGPQDGRADG